MILPFATQAMTDARREALLVKVTEYWDKPGNRDKMSKAMIEYWSDPKNREAMSKALFEYWSDPRSTEHRKILSELMIEYWSDPKNREAHGQLMVRYYSKPGNRKAHREACAFLPPGFYSNNQAKQHTRNQWRTFGLLRQPYQCTKCGKQYEGENFDYLQHMENCNHKPCLFTSALLKLQELPGNSPQTVKEDSESQKNLERRTHERRLRFSNDCTTFHGLLQNNAYYKRERRKKMNMLQKNKFRQQIDFEISEGRREKEEERQRIEDKNNKGWIKTPLQGGVFDNVDMDGNVSYTMGPYKYNLEWYDFQKKMRSGSVLQISSLRHRLRKELETSKRGVPHS